MTTASPSPPSTPFPVTPHAARTILAIADELHRAETELKQKMCELIAARKFDLLTELVNRWYDGAPTEVLAWLKQQPSSA